MPELAEVEVGRKVAASALEGERLVRIWTDDDDVVFAGVRPPVLARRLKGARATKAR